MGLGQGLIKDSTGRLIKDSTRTLPCVNTTAFAEQEKLHLARAILRENHRVVQYKLEV